MGNYFRETSFLPTNTPQKSDQPPFEKMKRAPFKLLADGVKVGVKTQ